jgi:hypothetical protein
MLIKDDAVIQSHAEKAVTERTRDITTKALEERVRNESLSTGADAGMDMTNPEARWGRKMDVQDVIRNLRLMNTNLTFEPARNFPSLMGVYVTEWTRDESTGGLSYGRRYVMAMENGMMPEFTIVYADQIMLPDPKDPQAKMRLKQFSSMKRGWRAVLVTLLREGIIQEGQLTQWKITEGQESRVWKEETEGTQPISVETKGGQDHGFFQRRTTSAGTSDANAGIETGTGITAAGCGHVTETVDRRPSGVGSIAVNT